MNQKHKLTFSDGTGRTADLELCCVCKELLDFNHPEKCVHYSNDYVDNACNGFVQVEDVEKRISEVLDCQCRKTEA